MGTGTLLRQSAHEGPDISAVLPGSEQKTFLLLF